jgi:hypothetical protein
MGEIDGDPGHVLLEPAGPPGDLLDDVAIPIARGERHARVVAGGVLPQHRLHGALLLDDHPPVQSGDDPQARDAVRHHDLREGQSLRRADFGFVGAQALLHHPLFERAAERGIVLLSLELKQESMDEERSEGSGIAREAGERRAEFAFRFGHPDTGDPSVRLLRLVESLNRSEGHPPYVLDQTQTEHGRQGPELSDGQRGDLLEGTDK